MTAPRPDRHLLLAALPALAGSVMLMHRAEAGPARLAQQLAVAVVSFAVVALMRPWPRGEGPFPRQALAMAGAVALLWAPMWSDTAAGPERWLRAGGVRIYVASVLLPVLVLVLAGALRAASTRPLAWWLMPTALWALAVQPDASQATAFALACALPLWRTTAGAGVKTLVAAALAAGVAWAWWQPDPLQPVPYVEGVLDLAWAAGGTAFVAALAALALPLLVLARQARLTGDAALAGVAVYYLATDVLAWCQLTPMPLLGFGAGPIVGYALMAAAARRHA